MADIDTPEKLKADLLNEPDVKAAMQADIDAYAHEFLTGCVRLAKQVQLMPDLWQAKRVIENMLWAVAEANAQAAKEITAASKPKPPFVGGIGID